MGKIGEEAIHIIPSVNNKDRLTDGQREIFFSPIHNSTRVHPVAK